MTVAAIMVTVDFDPASNARVTLAADLARRFGSLLIGVAGWPLIKRPVETLSDDELAERTSDELRRLGERFQKITEEFAVRVEWRSAMDFPREVLVVPPGLDRLDFSRALVAWKDTREARRAIHDALPFLKLADEVSIAAAKTPGAENVDAQIADVAKYLERHDVPVAEQISSVADEDVEDVLLDLVRQQRVNFIVAGAYGRTRLSEWIFGGVTRHLLLNSPVPCLLSN